MALCASLRRYAPLSLFCLSADYGLSIGEIYFMFSVCLKCEKLILIGSPKESNNFLCGISKDSMTGDFCKIKNFNGTCKSFQKKKLIKK